MAQIYRKTALDKISSPEQLDKSLKITSPLSWLVLLGLTLIVIVAVIWSIVGSIPETITLPGILAEPDGVCSVVATESGKAIEMKCDVNSSVSIGTDVLVYDTDSKNGLSLVSDQDGIVVKTFVEGGKTFESGDEILRITPSLNNKKLVAICYASKEEAKKVKDQLETIRGTSKNIEARVEVGGISTQKYGYLEARVFAIDSLPGDKKLAEIWGGAGNVAQEANGKIAIVCEFDFQDRETRTGLRWSNEKGYTKTVSARDPVTVKIVTDKIAPIRKLFQKLDEIWGGKK